MTMRSRFPLGVLALAALSATSSAVGPKGLWFITDGDNATDALIQGGSVSTFAQEANSVLQYPIQYNPFFDEFETIGRDQNQEGGVYDDQHNQTGSFLNFSSSDGEHLDGTLDTRRNISYASNYTYSTVLQYGDGFFNSPTTVLWTAPDQIWSITYSPTRDSLFVGGDFHITEIDMSGNVLNDFATLGGRVRSLAWDASDNSMWYLEDSGVNAYQIDALGNVLSVDAVNVGGNYWGGEIKAVPEPASMAALGAGFLAFVGRRRRRN